MTPKDFGMKKKIFFEDFELDKDQFKDIDKLQDRAKSEGNFEGGFLFKNKGSSSINDENNRINIDVKPIAKEIPIIEASEKKEDSEKSDADSQDGELSSDDEGMYYNLPLVSPSPS
jgi:hypothetical protein